MHRPEEAKEEDIGTGCGVFKVEKLGDEYFSFIVDCVEPKSCSIILRGASKDVLNEVRGPPFVVERFTSPIHVFSGLYSPRRATCRYTHAR